MKKNFTAHLIAALFFFLPSLAHAQIKEHDSLVLVNLYNKTNGQNWYNKNNWLTAAPVSSWYGITVKENRVTKIILAGNNLTGKIPASLGNLSQLTHLLLDYNSFDGRIPSSLGKLTNLKELNLANNWNLHNSIPASFNNLINLQSLQLQGIGLSGNIPSGLSNFKYLKILNLSSNQLSGNIPGFNNLKNLTYVNLSINNLTGNIPAGLGTLKKLKYIDFSLNQLSGNIPEFDLLDSLSELILAHNKLSGSIPASIGNLINLTYLEFFNNQLTGSIPSSLGNLTKITLLGLAFNHLSGSVPSSLLNLTNLNSLDLSFNNFTFSGMEKIAKAFPFAFYGGQGYIPIHLNGNILSVSAGGILSHNKYRWYKNGAVYATIKGDSTIIANGSGVYSVSVSNPHAPDLTLWSYALEYTEAGNLSAAKINNIAPAAIAYPNPATARVIISFSAVGKYTIIMADVSGKILQTKTGTAAKDINAIQLDVSKYAAGIYSITITDENKTSQKLKLVKQ